VPFVNNNGVKIYYEVEGEGPPLILAHGLGWNLKSWRIEGYRDVLRNDFRLILYDARGFGKSDKPHEPEAYSMEKRTSDVTAVLDDLGTESAHYFGFSWGGRIGLEVAKLAPERIKSLIVLFGRGGPKGRDSETANTRIKRFREAGLAGLVSLFPEPITPERKAELMTNDYEALIALHKAPTPNLETALPSMTMPVLLFGAEADPTNSEIIAASKLLPDATYVPFPGFHHGQLFSRSDILIPHIKKFLAEVSK
jgi:pimeloyl-ACP methyl ester carboxylesterase